MMSEKVKTVGIGLIDRIPGPFQLAIDRIWVRLYHTMSCGVAHVLIGSVGTGDE